MLTRNYYYLIAGLPDIVPEQSKAPFSLQEFALELQATLHPDDYRELEWFFLPADNRNLLHLIQKQEAPWEPIGRFSRETMEEGLKEPGLLLPYMDQFIQAFREGNILWPAMSWENQLTRLFHEYALENTTGFLHQWFSFENHLRNFLVARNAREYQLPLEGQLIGDNLVTEAARRSHARDLGLARELDFADKLLHALERDSPIEREKAVDRIRWSFINELNTFHYFSLEVVLGYFLQLEILSRWTHLDPERGKTLISDKIRKLENDFEIAQKFALA